MLLPVAALAVDQHAAVQPDALVWSAGPPILPPGGEQVLLAGDPGKEGSPYVVRFKAPAGYKIPAHTHPADENITVLSGSFHIGMGDKLDTTKGEKVRAGGFVHIAKGMQHYVWFSEPSAIQVHGLGPIDITYVNPADDPRNTTGAKK